jgi:hypothetical protein
MQRLIGPLILLILFSCGDNSEHPKQDLFSGYFPLQVGAYQIYDVEDVQIRQNVETVLVYQLKIIATDSFQNEESGYTYVLSRFKRTDESAPWTTLGTWSARITNREVIVNEGNIPFVRLILPLTTGQKWNGNELNTLGGDDNCGSVTTVSCDQFEITSFNESFELNGTTYDNTITVMEENDPDLLVKNDVRKSVYASGVGLIYVDNTVLNYCTSPPSCYGTQFVNSGIRYKQTWKQSGVEK